MRHLSAFLLGLVILTSSASAQVSQSTARRLGLETAWRTQVQLPGFGQGLVSSHLWTHPENSRQFAIVELPGRTIRIAEDTLDRDGNPIGIEEAKKQAQQYAARLLGRSDGFEVVTVKVPEVNLVLVTGDGLVQNLDAETGKVLWSSPCGNSRAPARAAAVSAVGVAVVHGSELHVLDWTTGKHKMVQRLRTSTSNAIALCGEMAFVSDFTGRVEAYGLGVELDPWSYVINGHAVGAPVTLATQDFCATASENGYVYVFLRGEKPSVYIRYETVSRLTGSLAAGNGAFYVGTSSGQLSKISVADRLGSIAWEYRSGETKTAPAFVFGDTVFAASETGKLVALDDANGFERWSVTGQAVAQPVGVSNKSLYAISRSGELLGFDTADGRLLGRSVPINLSSPVMNTVSDRVYLVSNTGQVQCLRPIGAELPTMHGPVVKPAEQPENGSPVVPETETTEGTTFGGNPFGGPEDAGMGGGDPFGGSGTTDPFGGDAGSDPFGGGADPFGGGGF